jgi:hypothetical protein
MLTAMGVLTLVMIRRTTGWPEFIGTLELVIVSIAVVLCLIGWSYYDLSTGNN